MTRAIQPLSGDGRGQSGKRIIQRHSVGGLAKEGSLRVSFYYYLWRYCPPLSAADNHWQGMKGEVEISSWWEQTTGMHLLLLLPSPSILRRSRPSSNMLILPKRCMLEKWLDREAMSGRYGASAITDTFKGQTSSAITILVPAKGRCAGESAQGRNQSLCAVTRDSCIPGFIEALEGLDKRDGIDGRASPPQNRISPPSIALCCGAKSEIGKQQLMADEPG